MQPTSSPQQLSQISNVLAAAADATIMNLVNVQLNHKAEHFLFVCHVYYLYFYDIILLTCISWDNMCDNSVDLKKKRHVYDAN